MVIFVLTMTTTITTTRLITLPLAHARGVIKLKDDEVGMAGSKSTQTRFVGDKHLLYIPTLAFLRGTKIMQLNQTDYPEPL